MGEARRDEVLLGALMNGPTSGPFFVLGRRRMEDRESKTI